LGEGSIDVGGPYRESLTNICADLMSNATPLFIPSPNGKNTVGLNREKYVPNPSATSTLAMAMFEFVGALFGIAIRTKNPLPLDLPSMLWKAILGGKADVGDLEAIDKLCIQALNELKTLPKDKFDYLVTTQTFTTQLSNNEEVELKTNGKDIPVTYELREEFVDLSIKARLSESSKQIAAIQKGLNSVVPLKFLTLFSWFDLEVMICGNPVIDVEALRRHTIFSGGLNASHPAVKFLFQVLHSFNTEERQLFLKFVWGRNRLPSTDADWGQQMTVNLLSTASDESLPISHTCFFSIDLPNYTSYAAMKKKIVYAIYNCTAIDVDFNASSASSLNAFLE